MPRGDNPTLPHGFIVIPEEILRNDKLSPIDKIVYGLVLATDLTVNGSFWENESLTMLFGGISTPTISKSYSALAEQKLITIIYERKQNGTIRRVRNNHRLGLKEFYRPDTKNFIHNTISSKEEIDKDLIKPCAHAKRGASEEKPSRKVHTSKRQTSTNSPAYRIGEYFRRITHREFGEVPILGAKDYRAAKEALKSMTQEQIKDLIEWVVTSDNDKAVWIRGHNFTLALTLDRATLTTYKLRNKNIGKKSIGIRAEPGKYAHLGTEMDNRKRGDK